MAITEGQEWTDGQFNYIAYCKADGRMVVRDVEGFDYCLEDWTVIVQNGVETGDDIIEVDSDLDGYVKIERWEAEVETLPR